MLYHELRDLPQPLHRQQRRFGGREIGVSCPAIVSQACGDGPMVAIEQTDDEVGIRPASNPNELHALAMQRMVRVSHGHPFQRRFAKGGSVL